jgi:hypothetical protein
VYSMAQLAQNEIGAEGTTKLKNKIGLNYRN